MWSDIPNNRILRYDEATGDVGVFRHPSNYTNGHTVDPQGRLVSCEHGARRVTRTEHDGTITVLAERYDGKRLNSPNDVVVRSDGTVYFTDPATASRAPTRASRPSQSRPRSYVFKLDPDHGQARASPPTTFSAPTGSRSAPTSACSTSPTRASRTCGRSTSPRRQLTNGREFAKCTVGGFDGFRLDEHGHIWSSAGDGVHVLHPDGTLIGKVLVPEGVANVAWGGYKRNRLYICATTSLYAILLAVRGAKTM